METFDSYEAAAWRQRAAAYVDFLAPVTGRAAEALATAAGVTGGTRVLDVATGPGQVAAACAARGARVVGVDVAPEMLALARERYPGLDFRRGDAHRLPVPDASVDAVLAGFALPHLGRPEQAAAEFVRVLAPGGTVALSTWDDPGRARLVGVFVEALAEVGAPAPASLPPGQPFFRFADRDELCRLLTGAGLTGVSVSTVAFNHRFAGPDALWDGMMSATVRTRDSILGQAVGVQAAIRAAYDRRVSPYVVAGGALELPVSVTLGVGRRAP